MALSTVPKTKFQGTVVIADSTGAPISATMAFIQADMGLSGVQQGLRNKTRIEVRGSHKYSHLTTRAYPQFTIEQLMADLSNSTAGALPDFALKLGALSSGVSQHGANAPVFAVKITITWEGTDFGDSADHTLVLNKCECDDVSITEGEDGNRLASTWTVIGDVTLDGNTITAP